MNQLNNYQYTTQEARYKRMNRFFLLAVNLLFVIMLFYQIIQVVKPDREAFTTGWNIFVLIGFCILNIIIYMRNRATAYLKLAAVIEVALEFVILCINPTASFLGLCFIGVLCVLIPYFDGKFYKITFFSYLVLYTGGQIFRFATNREVLTANGLCNILITYAIFVVVIRTGTICQKFSEHALASAEQQSIHLSRLLHEILEISSTIREESVSSTKTMDYLLESAMNTTASMENISDSTNITAENIEQQNRMTQNIQSAIFETKQRSEKMVSIASASNQDISQNHQMMEELRKQAEQVSKTNRLVTEAMAKLATNTKEVENIAGIILNISSQTNLLALNASIESAHAGEAGRGFAVVAEHIRQLSEETRKSTEDITNLLEELNSNAAEVMNVIDSSVAAAEVQNDIILTSSEIFEKLQTNMTELLTDINEIDVEIENLSGANNTIVDKITNLSASTKEVTNIAEKTNALSRQNLEYTQQAKDAIALIQENVARLGEYMVP